MSKEILMVVDAVSNEKGVEKKIIFEAIEAALASAARCASMARTYRCRVANRPCHSDTSVPALAGLPRQIDQNSSFRIRNCGSSTRSTSTRIPARWLR